MYRLNREATATSCVWFGDSHATAAKRGRRDRPANDGNGKARRKSRASPLWQSQFLAVFIRIHYVLTGAITLPTSCSPLVYTMDEEEDAPPMLVTAGGTNPTEATLSADMENVKITRVPITIITGKLCYGLSLSLKAQ